MMKVNSDATTDVHKNAFAFGVIVRNYERDIKVSICSGPLPIQHPTIVEALALIRIMQLCSTMEFSKAIFEGDCL